MQQMCMLYSPSLSCLIAKAVKHIDPDYIPKSQLHSMIGDQPNMSFQLWAMAAKPSDSYMQLSSVVTAGAVLHGLAVSCVAEL